MSILTCEEAAASLSSSNNMNNGAIFYPSHDPPQQIKKKRNQPGNPDPEAEVIALSPKTLLATNRFFCEICNKGFQRDQNLQLHRRGHNLPWKLKKRENKELARKKVYVCPESSCVHHNPSRALGDLTGIKKHFSRKHGEKKWKCEKCSKCYAVQSDCKAHFKICGTREYKCECGTIFSRRDSFITHRAFCETLAVESARSANPTIFSSQMNLQFQQPQYFSRHHGHLPAATLFSTKKEEQPISNDHFRHTEIPPWLMTTNSQPFQLGAASISGTLPVLNNFNSSSIFPANQQYSQSGQEDLNLHDHNPNPNIRGLISSRGESVHISATEMLQKSADQFGATTVSNKASAVTGPGSAKIPHNTHESVTSTIDTVAKQIAQNLSSREELMTTTCGPANISGMMTSFSNFANGFEGSTFEDALLFGGFTNLNSKKEVGDDDDDQQQLYFNQEDHMTKDFLGLRTLSHTDDIFNNIASFSTTKGRGPANGAAPPLTRYFEFES